MKNLLISVFSLIILSTTTNSQILNVPGDYATIQAALNAAKSGETVLVQPGTYYENIIWPDRNGIKLISDGDTTNTIINGQGNSSVVTILPLAANIDTNTLIKGFKITNGGDVTWGGGIFVKSASPLFENLLVANNQSTAGGGIAFDDSQGKLRNSIIRNNNVKGLGGGISIGASGVEITNTKIYSNNGLNGGGISIVNKIHTTKLNNVFIHDNNSSFTGGGIYCSVGQFSFENVLIYNNSTRTRGGGIIFLEEQGIISFKNVYIFKNTADYGGGIESFPENFEDITNLVLADNFANEAGGGIYSSSGDISLSNISLIRNETNGYGGGIHLNTNINSTNIDRITAINNMALQGDGIYIPNGATVIKNSNFDNNGKAIINSNNNADNITEAKTNWWGDASGPYHASQNIDGQGDTTNFLVNVIPFLTTPDISAPPIPINNLQIISSSNTAIELLWDESPLSDLAGYKVYYNNGSKGYTFENTIDVGNDTTYTLSNLTTQSWYTISVTCYDTDGNESWYSNEVSGFTLSLPDIPNLSSPDKDSKNVLKSITLMWNEASNAVSYHLQVSIQPDFSFLLLEDSTLNSTNKDLKNLTQLTKYYWRVRAKNEAGYSDWSETWNFTTILDKPIPVSIANGSINIKFPLTLSWEPVDSASFYIIEVDTNKNFSNPFVNDTTLTETNKILDNLLFSTKYFWRVRAKEDNFYSDWSEVWDFNTIVDKPDDPVLLNPQNASTEVRFPLTLAWTKVDSVNFYFVEVDTNQTFANPVISDTTLTDTSKVLNDLLYSKKYYWRVRAKNLGGYSDWSEIWNFTTIVDKPSVVTLVYPGNKKKKIPYNNPEMKWNNVDLADFYFLEVSTEPDFNDVSFSDSTLTDTTKVLMNLLEGTNYFWHVGASNKGGKSEFSETWSFVTILNSPDSLKAEPDQDGYVNLSWIDKSSNEVGFIIERKLGDSLSTNAYLIHDHVSANETSFTDFNIIPNETEYTYRIQSYNDIDSSYYSNQVSVLLTSTVGIETNDKFIPNDYQLYQNYPNPFNPSTRIKYDIPKESNVKIIAYNLMGERIEYLFEGLRLPGAYEEIFNAGNLSSGVYLIKITASSTEGNDSFTEHIKVLLIK